LPGFHLFAEAPGCELIASKFVDFEPFEDDVFDIEDVD